MVVVVVVVLIVLFDVVVVVGLPVMHVDERAVTRDCHVTDARRAS
jgi:hypothetical protein